MESRMQTNPLRPRLASAESERPGDRASSPPPTTALMLLWCALCCVPLATFNLMKLSWLSIRGDFVTYWSAARLFLAHANPYDPRLVLAVQHAIGWPLARPAVMFCPPWALPIVAACGLLPFAMAQVLWLAAAVTLDVFSALALWRYFGGERRSSWIALIVMLTFVPLNLSEHVGQITPLMLFSLTAILWLLRRKQWFLAGVCTIGFGAKPHLLWLVLIAFVAWAVQQRRWQLLAGAAAALIAAAAAALAWDPAAGQYFHEVYGSAISTDCGAGAVLRMIFGEQRTWLQYVPCAFGAVWFAWYWKRHRGAWNWQEDLPLLLLVSIASSPYCWFRDYIVAFPAFIALAVRGAWRSPRVVALWLFVQALILAIPTEAGKAAASVLWIGFWLVGRRELDGMTQPSQTASEPHSAPAPA